MNIREAAAKFKTDEDCLTYLEQMRWPDGRVRCPECGAANPAKVERKATSRNKRGWFYLCSEKTCRHQFSPTSGTIFHDTHLPLIVWFHAIALMLNAKKGISAKQLQRDLGIGGYKTAWYLNHRIREAMIDADAPKLGGIVEIDETYIGGKQKGKGVWYGKNSKEVVVGVRQRKGQLRFVHTPDAKIGTIKDVIAAHLGNEVEFVMTDEHPSYPNAMRDTELADKHRVITHKNRKYVEGMVHTNTIESAFSLLKRGIVGNFHKVSIKHLQRYLNEFSYRFNRREDADAFIQTVRRLCRFGPLTFTALTSEKA
jgi:transposase-like protein